MHYSHFDDEIKQDVFKEKTTYTNDYKWYPDAKKEIQIWSRDGSEKPKKPSAKYVFTDHETYLPWREGVYIPFSLLLRPKPIINTNPYATFEKPTIPESTENQKIEAIKTRPRIYMSPAVSMDDVPDPEVRKLLLQHMYSTDWRKSAEEAALPISKKILPSTVVEEDSVALHVDLFKPLPEHWRHVGRKWDHEQMRACVDPTTTFWVHKDPPVKCGACINPVKGLVPNEMTEHIASLLQQDKLRIAHDKTVPGYAGYKPRLSKGVTLPKADLSVVHPFVSVTQAITKRYAADYLPRQ